MKPIIKYIGGKGEDYKYFQQYIPNNFNTYFEPFCGGCAVFFLLHPNRAVLSDIQKDLIKFYKSLTTHTITTLNQITTLVEQYDNNSVKNNKNLYYQIRDMFNNKIPSKYNYATLYYFLNKDCFSGMTRFNQKGEFNVPFSYYKQIATPNLKSIVFLKHHAKLDCSDYSNELKQAKTDDFVYLDPPYMTRYKNYGRNEPFGIHHQIQLANIFKRLPCKALMTINSTKLTRKLYANYIVNSYNKNYRFNISGRNSNDKDNILIITNYKATNKTEE